MNTINFNRDKYERLKEQYAAAKAAGLEQFEFEGHALLVAYAKYLIQYLDTLFTTTENIHEYANQKQNP